MVAAKEILVPVMSHFIAVRGKGQVIFLHTFAVIFELTGMAKPIVMTAMKLNWNEGVQRSTGENRRIIIAAMATNVAIE